MDEADHGGQPPPPRAEPQPHVQDDGDPAQEDGEACPPGGVARDGGVEVRRDHRLAPRQRGADEVPLVLGELSPGFGPLAGGFLARADQDEERRVPFLTDRRQPDRVDLIGELPGEVRLEPHVADPLRQVEFGDGGPDVADHEHHAALEVAQLVAVGHPGLAEYRGSNLGNPVGRERQAQVGVDPAGGQVELALGPDLQRLAERLDRDVPDHRHARLRRGDLVRGGLEVLLQLLARELLVPVGVDLGEEVGLHPGAGPLGQRHLLVTVGIVGRQEGVDLVG